MLTKNAYETERKKNGILRKWKKESRKQRGKKGERKKDKLTGEE